MLQVRKTDEKQGRYKKELLSTRASVGMGELIQSLHTDWRECWRDLQRQDSWQGLHLVPVVVVVVVYIQGLHLVEDPDHQPSLYTSQVRSCAAGGHR